MTRPLLTDQAGSVGSRSGGRLSWKEKVGYALGDTASNFYWKTFEFFLLIFYTDVFGLSPAAAGTMFGLTRIWDAVNDPIMGTLADRTRSRFGRFRPYLLWMALPFAVAGVLTFTTPDLGSTGKLVWAYCTYTFMMMAYTAINIPYGALMGVMTPDTQARTGLSSMRFIGGFSGGILVVSTTPWLVQTLGAGNDARGWQLCMVIWGVLAIALFLVCFVTTRERVAPPPRQTANLRRELRDLLSNRPWVVMFLLGIITLTSFIMRGQNTAYYFKYYVGDESYLGLFISTGMLVSIVGFALTEPLARLCGGKKNLYMGLMAVSGLLTIAFYLIPADAIGLILGLNLVILFIQAPNSPLVWAMYADTADYGEWKFGRRNTGLVFSAATMAQKGGAALAGMVNGFLLAAFGYVANQPQAPEALFGIRLMMSVLPGLLCLLAAAVALLYPLDLGTTRQMERDLEARRGLPEES